MALITLQKTKLNNNLRKASWQIPDIGRELYLHQRMHTRMIGKGNMVTVKKKC